METIEPQPMTPASRFRLRPIEWVTLGAFLASFLLVVSYGRSYTFLLFDNLKVIGVQLSWLMPCFIVRFLFAIYRVRPEVARRTYIAYYLFLALAFFGTSVEKTLTDWAIMSKMNLLIIWAVRLNLLFFAVALILSLFAFAKDRVHVRTVFRQEFFDALLLLRLMISVVICFDIYSNLKAMVPLVHPGLMDDIFYAMDKILFFGNDPYPWIEAHSTPTMLTLMERSYFFFFFFIVFGMTGSYLFGSVRWFERTVAAFIIAYILGLIGYLLFPAVGPAFYNETLTYLQASAGNGLKTKLLTHYIDFCNNPQTATLVRFNGLAAFPSLHCAHSVLFMYYLGKKERWMPVILALPLVLLLISTVWLGWHWAVDLIGGLVVVWLTIRIVAKLYPEPKKETEEPESEQATT